MQRLFPGHAGPGGFLKRFVEGIICTRGAPAPLWKTQNSAPGPLERLEAIWRGKLTGEGGMK